jgi:hypothetical protein
MYTIYISDISDIEDEDEGNIIKSSDSIRTRVILLRVKVFI